VPSGPGSSAGRGSGVVSLTAALDWLDAAGTDRIERWTVALTSRHTDGLARMEAFEVLGCRSSLTSGTEVQRRRSLVSFRHRETGSRDLGFILFSHGSMVRTDGHCQAGQGAEEGSVREGLHVHNTPQEIDALLSTLANLQ
jgi:cysteine desulfurase/selenocysteine lyase